MAVTFPIYLDYQATTPMDPAVVEFMLPYLTDKYGNPHSADHRFGWEAAAAVDVAREDIASVISASEKEIVFTSGATEANNLAIKGVMQAHMPHKTHLITVATEHKCVLESAAYMERMGCRVTYLPINGQGVIDLGELEAAVADDTALISVMAVNNEIGTIQPLKDIGKIAKRHGVLFHTDAAQAFGKIPLDVNAMGVDLMSISAHKAYGPKGVGALYVRRAPHVKVEPQMHGGGQENGLRSGTLSPALCAGFGKAAQLALARHEVEFKRLSKLSAIFRGRIMRGLDDITINGGLDYRFPGNLNISFSNIDGDRLIAKLRNLALSSGSACSSSQTEASYVLKSLGVSDEMAKASLRIGFGRFTSDEEVMFAADLIVDVVRELREG